MVLGLIKPFHVIYQKWLILLFVPEPFLVPPLFNSDFCNRASAVTHSQVEREREEVFEGTNFIKIKQVRGKETLVRSSLK